MLLVFMLNVLVNQMLWISFAPITNDAAQVLKVSPLDIGILSMSFMIVFIFASIPASWIIDKYGIKIGVGTGALLTGVFGFMRGMVGLDYNLILIAQIGIAIGQPFLLNAITKLAARWFRVEERATAAGMGSLAMYLGILAGMLLAPVFFNNMGLDGMLHVFGMASLISAVLFVVLAKEKPLTPPCAMEDEARSLVYDGLKSTVKNKNFQWLFQIFFIGLGIFNSVTTWIEEILRPRGFNADEAGMAGGLMIIGGIVGAIILPTLSDKLRNRKHFIMIALAGCVLGMAGLTWSTEYWQLLVSGALLGFFLLSAGPIGFQYGAEITYPASEGTSNGLLILAGQISGIAFIFAMDALKDPDSQSMQSPMILMVVLALVTFLISFKLKESPMMKPKN